MNSMSKPKPKWLIDAAEFIRSEGIVAVLLMLLFSPALILALRVHAMIRVWEIHRDGASRRPAHESLSVFLTPWAVLPALVLVWAIVLLIASAAICYRLFNAH
jgi:hypothetical protein